MVSFLPGLILAGARAALRRPWRAAIVLLVLAAACGTAASGPGVAVPPSPPASWSAGGAEGGISPILATTVLRTGRQRVSFLLVGPDALVKAPEVTVATTYLDGDGVAGETRPAAFHSWPYGIRGSYTTHLTFDQPGAWRLDISVDDGQLAGDTHLTVQVAQKPLVPDIGEIPPRSRTKTLAGEGGLKTLTTAYAPDPDLYLISVEEAIQDAKPDVIVFATPAFCTSPTCGPQTETVAELKESYRGQANFIHVEIYDNPHEIQGDLSRARITGAVQEWGFDRIPGWFNESWTYVLDSEGRVYQKFEGFVTLEELETTLKAVLPPG